MGDVLVITRPAPACAGEDPALFFGPDGTESWEQRLLREADAKKVCHRCQLIAQCLQSALDRNEQHGVWGGLGEDERRLARRRERRQQKAGAA